MNDIIVIGAGQAGLTAGYRLNATPWTYEILQAGPEASGSWPHYYNSLKLFSPARYSSLPGSPFPSAADHFPSRDEVSAYLKQYALEHRLPIRTNADVEHVRQTPEGFELRTRSGQLHHARALIAATGAFHAPYQPSLTDQSAFTGQILHSRAYQTPQAFSGQRVIVVGAGNSAVQIAVELARVATVTLAVREPVQFAPRRILGLDFHAFLHLIDRLPLGHLLDLSSAKQVWDFGEYHQAIAQGKPFQKPMFARFTATGVQWADGFREDIDSVIFATGYTHSLPYLLQTPALGALGKPLHRHGISTSVAGLYYLGMSGQRTLASATLRGVDADARVVVKHLNTFLRRAKSDRTKSAHAGQAV